MKVLLKRMYEPPGDEVWHVLVDRLWPRVVSKEHAALDLWDRGLAPSDHLRRAFHHEGLSHDEFVERYRTEIAARPHAFATLRNARRAHDRVTLLFSSVDTDHAHATVLRDLLLEDA